MKRLFLALLITLLAAPTAWADVYHSFYSEPQQIEYSAASGYTQFRTVTGYQNIYNLDDPIIRCHSVNPCNLIPEQNIGFVIPGQRSRFKVFIPPGTTAFEMTVMLSQPSKFVVVARFGQPPTGTYSTWPDAAFSALPTYGFYMDQLKKGDCVGRNSSGFLNVFADGNAAITEATAGWLYVNLIPIYGYATNNIFSNTINTGQFMAWFRKMTWAGFEQGIVVPPPVPIQPVITPSPAPQPIITPSPSGVIEIKIVPGALYRFVQ